MLGWLATLPLRVAHRLTQMQSEDGRSRVGVESERVSWGRHTLAAAWETLGWGEEGGNNTGPDIERLRRGHQAGTAGAWCAAAASHWIEEGWARYLGYMYWDCISRDEQDRCPVRRHHGARALVRQVARAGTLVELDDARAGDLLLWDRSVPGRSDSAWWGHVGIVSAVGPSGPTHYLAGNEGPYPARVRSHRMRTARLLLVARLP